MSLRRLDKQVLIDLIDRLSLSPVEQFAQYDTLCQVCGTQKYGILDESKLTLPLSLVPERGLKEYFFKRHRFGGHGIPSRFTVIASSLYEIRMDIVRSGMFTRAQLSNGCFNQHELEINDYSFKKVRPPRCDCDFGPASELSEYELAMIAEFGDPSSITEVEEAFIASEPVPTRTGFRARSVEARKRRRSKSRRRSSSAPSLSRTVYAFTPKVLRDLVPPEFCLTERVAINVDFKKGTPFTKVHKDRSRRGRKAPARKESIMAPFVRLPKKSHTKYWYFLRKRNEYHYSLHHPYGDEF